MRLPHYYNLAFGLTVPTFLAAISFTSFFGVGSWNLNRTINWGWAMSFEVYFTLLYLLAFGPAIIAFGLFLYWFIRREELRLSRVLGALLFLFVSSFLVPAFIFA